ncbi:MAG: glycosyltransferase [Candidatus Magasanikbacteria bacterium]|nr:glycosyltransferase [Candidatus Magasanikbacteria bacterium]
MRLLIAADIFPPESGGPATYCVTLANELVKQGIKVKIVSLNKQSDKGVLDPKVKLYRVHFKNMLFRYGEYFLLLWVLIWRTDIVYAMGPVNAGWPARLACLLRPRKKKLAVKVVGDYAWEQGQVLGLVKEGIDDFQKRQYRGKIGSLRNKEIAVTKHASLVIVPSEYLEELVIGWGVNPERVRVIYNEVFLPTELLTELASSPKNLKRIIIIGRLMPWKGVMTMVEIMPELLRRDSSYQLVIIGDGPERGRIQSLIQQLQLESAVQMLGPLSHDQALREMAKSGLLVLNSRYEGLPHVILESWLVGCPVFASNIVAHVELLQRRYQFPDGLLFKPDEKEVMISGILKLTTDNKTREIIIKNRQQLLPNKGLSGDNMIALTRQALQQVCAS